MIDPLRILVLADTHLRDDLSRLPDDVWDHVDAVHVVLHAGDVVAPDLLAALRARRPVHAVLGNNDGALRGLLPETVEAELGGVRVAMIHDTGPRSGREGRMRRRFPNAEVVVFGHSHIPWNEPGLDGQWLLNPGSPTERRGQPHRTMATIDITDGRFRTEVVTVD